MHLCDSTAQMKSGANERTDTEQTCLLSEDCGSLLKEFHRLQKGSQNFKEDLSGAILKVKIPNLWKSLKLDFIRI